MIVKRGEGDYPRTYRPRRVSELYGPEEIKRIIGNGLDKGTLPHSMLFHGISGTGKTTCARIVGAGLLCDKGKISEPCWVYSCDDTSDAYIPKNILLLEDRFERYRPKYVPVKGAGGKSAEKSL
jgi:DNA polymerase III delta prime subunit